MIKNRMMKKLSAGFMAGLCAFSMLGSNLSKAIPARAASVSTTENAAFPSADEVIAQAATLLGTKYLFGYKGFTGVYYQGSYKPLSEDFIRNQGIDCSGLVYYTLTHLGYSTSGFSWNNPVPVDTAHWLSVGDNCTITYGGVTSKVDVEKKQISTEERPYWECADGSTITPGSVIVAEHPDTADHAWIYMGEFDSRADVVTYLKNIGVDESLITTVTVDNGNGDGGRHWRIESNGSQGVVINNNTDGKKATAMTMSAFRITQTDVTFSLLKVNKDTQVLIGKSPVDNSTAVYGVYTDKDCTNKVAEITIGDNGRGSVKLSSGTYYAKEIKAPTGYALDETVYTLSAGNTVTVPEEVLDGTIKINKTAEDGIVAGREFKVEGSDGKSYTKTTNASGIAEFTELPVYDMTAGKAITYTISEINVETRYETPKAQNVTLTSGSVDLTVTANFVNELKTGSIRINKQSEDGQNGDRTFTITGNGETYTITTGADGIAILSDIPVYNSKNEKIEYTISEKDVPIRYVVPADQTATLTADATVDVTFENILKKFTVEVVKKDIENGTAQGDASLAGAVYGIYNGDELIDTYTTDEYGSFTTHEFNCGENWTIKELTPSEGYLLDSTVYEVGAEKKKYTIENNAIEMTVYETPVKGKISIIKHSDDGTTGIETPEVGAEFDIYLKSAGSFENAKDSERDHLICDENGFAQTKMLPYGVYVVHQTVGWNNTEWVDDFEVNVCENEEDYFYIINDAVLTSYVKIPSMIDRLVQQCILQVLEPICEAKFHERSNGFRPNRSAEHALAQCYRMIQKQNLHFVVDVDIKGFFDNVNHSKLIRQLWTLGIRDKQLICIIKQMLKAPIVMPDGRTVYPTKGTPQGGILSPLLANIVLNELDWWISSQWETIPTHNVYKTQTKGNGTQTRGNVYAALKKTKLKEMFIVRYADDFKIFCRKRNDAQRIFIAVKQWLKDRLKLEISEDKSKVVNLKKHYSEFLGFKLKAVRKGGGFVVRSHMSDKSINQETRKLIEQIKAAEHSSQTAFEIVLYNSIVVGIHNYYKYATCISMDCAKIQYRISSIWQNRFRGRLKRQGNTSRKMLIAKYGGSKAIRFIGDEPICPISYVRTKNPMYKKRKICKYTAEGREEIHKNLKFDEYTYAVLKMLAKEYLHNRSVEYMDNRVSLYAAQYGKCAVTGKMLWIDEIHCHHKKPISQGGTDEYKNLVIIHADVHRLIHAVKPETIKAYLNKIKPNKSQLDKINKFRVSAGNAEI